MHITGKASDLQSKGLLIYLFYLRWKIKMQCGKRERLWTGSINYAKDCNCVLESAVLVTERTDLEPWWNVAIFSAGYFYIFFILFVYKMFSIFYGMRNSFNKKLSKWMKHTEVWFWVCYKCPWEESGELNQTASDTPGNVLLMLLNGFTHCDWEYTPIPYVR